MLGEYLLDIIMCKETVLHKKDRKVVYQKTESSEWKASSIQFHNYCLITVDALREEKKQLVGISSRSKTFSVLSWKVLPLIVI